MLTFLRKIRRSLIESGSTQKYLLYAIGEIALVVIGILIALQINNWNENKKDIRAKDEAVSDLYQEFITNREDFEEHINFLKTTVLSWEDYLDRVTDPEIIRSGELTRRPRSASRKFYPKISALLSILNTGKIDKIKSSELKHALTSWASHFSDFQDVQELYDEFFRNDFFPYETKYHRTYISEEGKSEYEFTNDKEVDNLRLALNDRVYQNLLLTSFDMLKLKISETDRVQEEINKIISLLEKEMTL